MGNYIYSLLLGMSVLVCVFRRKVMVPTRLGVNERGGEQPGRPRPTS
jgi:hypothetical protein